MPVTDRLPASSLPDNLPEATPKPCSDCPWRRYGHMPGWLGPYTAEEWTEIAHSDSPIACHQTITETNDEGTGDWSHPAMRQCRGAAIFRANVGKSPRRGDVVTGPMSQDVFQSNEEFYAFHDPNRRLLCWNCERQVAYVPATRDRRPYFVHTGRHTGGRVCTALKNQKNQRVGVAIVDPKTDRRYR